MNTSLGIAFTGNHIFFSELVLENNSVRLNNVESLEVDFDFEDSFHKHKSSQKDLTNISNEIHGYIKKRNLSGFDVSLTISSSQAFMLTLPLDYSEGKQSLNSKIYWELSNYFPDNYNEYVFNTYRLNQNMPSIDTDEFLVVAIMKNTLEFVKRIFNLCNIALRLVDIDHFSAEFSFRKGYAPQLENKKVLLGGFKKGRLDFGIINNKKYKSYMYTKYNSEIDINLTLIKKLNSILEAQSKSGGIDSIYLYGEEITPGTPDTIKSVAGVPVEIINPFYGINASDILLHNEGLRKDAYKYASSCGAALRSIQSLVS